MSNCRLNKKIFLWSNNISFNKVKNWNCRVNTKFKELDLNQYCNIECILSKSVIRDIENKLFIMYQNNWHLNLLANESSKLRT